MCTRRIDQSALSLVQVIDSFSAPKPPFFALLVIVGLGPVRILVLARTVLGSVSRERGGALQSRVGKGLLSCCSALGFFSLSGGGCRPGLLS